MFLRQVLVAEIYILVLSYVRPYTLELLYYTLFYFQYFEIIIFNIL